MLTKLLLLTLASSVFTQNYSCSRRSALMLLRTPIHEFSMHILDRVSQTTDAHFIFSPLSSWLQLTALAEGASGNTFTEIWKVTRHHRNKCFKHKLAKLLSKIDRRLIHNFRRKSVLIIDELMDVKKEFVKNIQTLYRMRVISKNFLYKKTLAKQVNDFIEFDSNNIKDIVYEDDFDQSVMIMSDNIYFKGAWKKPFKSLYTSEELFFGTHGIKGKVNMMSQLGRYYTCDLPLLNARAIDLPLSNDISMIVFLPNKNIWVGDIFYDLSRTKLTYVLNKLDNEGEKSVFLKLPRFRVNTTIDNLPELYYDMGVKQAFMAGKAQFNRISKFKGVVPSLMTQTAFIEVNEDGVQVEADSLYKPKPNEEIINFEVNTAFAFLIVDKRSHLSLFGGVYSVPMLF